MTTILPISSLRRFAVLAASACLFLGLGWITPLAAQSEAQSTVDQIVFQNKKRPQKAYTVELGSKIKYPVADGRRIKDEKGRVVQIADSVIVVENRYAMEQVVDLRTIPYIKVVRKGRRTWGIVLTAIGAGLSIITIGFAIIVVGVFGGGGLGLIFLFSLLYSILTNYFLIIGVPLWAASTKKLWLDRWSFSRFRRKVVRKIIQRKPAR